MSICHATTDIVFEHSPHAPQDTLKDDLIRRLSIFDGIDADAREQVKSIMEPVSAGRFRYIYYQGHRAQYLYLLAQGVVKIGTFHSDGREIIKQILHPEAIFGELSMISEERHTDYALTGNEEVVLYRIETFEFRKLLQKHPELYFNILTMIGRRLRHTEKRLESLIFKDARERIVDFLRQTAERHGMQVGFETFFKHNLTQQDIANLTGTSRQTVTLVLNDLRKSNKIYFNRNSVLIRDLVNLC